jgi:flagellar operon protein
MIDPNNRIPASGVSYGSKSQSGQPIPRGGGDDFERLLRQNYVQQQSRKAQQPVDPALIAANAVVPEAIHFSKHALQRLEKRQIELAPEQNRRLESAVHAAADKGARQSLVMMDGIAFVVNVHNRTVVTALDLTGEAKGAATPVFTNIDSAVLA